MLGPREELVTAGGVTFGRARPGAAVASHPARRVIALAPAPVPIPPRPSWRESAHPLARRWDGLCREVEKWAARRQLSLDLADDIGSAHWFRGMTTLLGLTILALALWPSFAPLEAAPLTVLDDTAQGELRAQAIRSYRMGATNGRHFAAGDAVIRLQAAPERPTIQLAATLGDNDNLPRMLQRAGVGERDAGQVATMVRSVVPLDQITPGTRFEIALGQRSSASDPRPLTGLAFRPKFDLALSIARQGDGLALERLPIAVDTRPLRIRGVVGGSLYRSARAAGAPPESVQDYLQTIDQFLPFEEIAAGDEFDLVISYKRTADGQGQAGNLLYAGVIGGGKPKLQLLRWGPDGGFTSLDALSGGIRSDSGMLGSPVAGRITSLYGARRHPILGYVRMHAGVDFGAAWGSPVYAVTEGSVAYAGWHGGHGNYIRLEHGGGIATGYGHLSRLAVSAGMTVRRGQVIGYVGSTGLSTGPHLHYELYRGGQTVNPLSVRFVVRQQVVDARQLSAFKARLHEMMALRTGFGPAR